MSFSEGFHRKAITEGHFQPKGQYQEVTFFRRSPSSLWAAPPPRDRPPMEADHPPIGRSPPVGRSPEWTWDQAARQKLTSYPLPLWTDKHTWKHYLPTTLFAGSNYTLSLSTSLWSLFLLCVLLSWPNFCVKIYHGPHKMFFQRTVRWTHVHWTYFYIRRSDKADFLLDAELTIKSNGSIYQIVPSVIETSCAIDITNFPVDEQTCHFKVVLK